MAEKSRWVLKTEEDPNHSHWYVDRMRTKAAEGEDLAGEARFIDAMIHRGARILDAGCGPGRVSAALAERGHEVVGVDVDPVLIAAAEQDFAGPTWFVGDLAELDLPTHGIAADFDVIVAAGNVMTFLAPSTRQEVLRRLARHLGAGGRVVVGFGVGRDYSFDEFFGDAAAAGLDVDLKLSTWDLRPFTMASDFLIAVLVVAD